MDEASSAAAGWSKRRNLKRWLIGAAVGVVALFVVVCLAAHRIVVAVIRHEIQAAVAGSLNATVEIDDLKWSPLLNVSVGHARLVGADGKPLAELSGLKVGLAKIPWGGPIVVEDFQLIDPTIVLTQSASGEIGLEDGLLRASTGSSTASKGSDEKISQVIQVRHLEIRNLTLRVRDEKGGGEPRSLARVDVKADLTSGAATYEFHISGAGAPLSDLKLDGSADVDGTSVRLAEFSAAARVPEESGLSQLPAGIAAPCREYGLAGAQATLTVEPGATASVDLSGGRWSVRNLRGDVKLSETAGEQAGGTEVSGRVRFSVAAGGPLAGMGAGAAYVGAMDRDSVVSVDVDPQDKLALSSPRLPQAITDATGAVELANGTLTVKAVDLHYGSEEIGLETAGSVLKDRLELRGLRLNVARGAVMVDQAHVELSRPYGYSANLAWSGIELSEVVKVAQISDPQGHLSGQASGTLSVSGAAPPAGVSPLMNSAGEGRFKVENGDLFDIPVIGEVAGRVAPDMQQAGRVGQAAGVFTFTGGTLNLSKVAVSCPLVGIQGSGSVGMLGENPVNLNLIVAPLGDWKKQVSGAGIPLLGTMVGDVQKTLNKVQGALYSFHVTGPAANPSIQPVAAPALNAASKNIFDQMLGNQGAAGLLDLLQPEKKGK